MTDPLIFILAGEPSGDRLGAELIRSARARAGLRFEGVGGPAMREAGMDSLFPMADLTVMGFEDVQARMPLLQRRLGDTLAAIERSRPDCVVLIDSQEFSNAVASHLRKEGFAGKILLYVAPTVGIWRPERAAAIKPLYDEVLAIFPGDSARMVELRGPPTTYVGHVAARSIEPTGAPDPSGPILLLPGSRTGELSRHLPLMRTVAERLHAALPDTLLCMPTLPALATDLAAATSDWIVRPEILTGDAADKAFSRASMAVAVVGTVTLELALYGIPMLVCYRLDDGQTSFYRTINPQALALPNIILGRRIVPEFVGLDVNAGHMAAAAVDLAVDADKKAAQRAAFKSLRSILSVGTDEEPAIDPAERVLAHIKRAG